jgi:MerR family transcriptional regulator, aldehyde-responsive regulator
MSDTELSWLTPAEMAERTGTTIDTLRYYEKERLITGVARAASGHRRYSEADAGWIEVLRCLRLTGMSIQQMKHFAELGQQGQQTAPERYRMLLDHRQLVLAQIAELHDALAVLDRKTASYRDALEQNGLLT